MKKLLIAGLTALSLLTVPAQAGNPWPVIGGIAGGLLLGEILTQNHHYHGPRSGYYVEPYYDEPMCWYEYRQIWNHHLHRYVTQKVRFCD